MTELVSVTTKRLLSSLCDKLEKADVVCLDVETQTDKGHNNLEDWHPDSRITSASFTFREGLSWVVPVSHPVAPWSKHHRKVMWYMAKAMGNNPDIRIVAHNSKYDLRWIYSMTGIALEKRLWWDTMMADYIIDENQSHRLKEVVPRVLGIDRWDNANLADSESEEWNVLAEYNAKDTDYCLRLVPYQKAELSRDRRLARVFHYLGMPIIRTLIRVERTGLPLDVEQVEKRRVECSQVVDELTEKLLIKAEELGINPDDYPTVSFASSTSKFFKAFAEAAEIPVIKRTPSGAPSYDRETLEELAKEHEVCRHLMELRKASNKLSKFFVPWTEKLAPDGRLHPTFNPMKTADKFGKEVGTVTGRLSSSNPNAQQIAREEKQCFGAEEGWLFVEIDYSQIELRVAAEVAQEENMLTAYREGADLHTLMASRITGKKLDEVTKAERQGGKAGNFGFLYDMSAQGYVNYARSVYGVDVGLDEAKEVRSAFFQQWPGLVSWHARQKTLAFRNGFVRNPLGRRRHLPDIYSGNDYLIGRAERQAINSPVQSFASDLLLISLIEIEKATDPEEFRLVGTVHDSLLAQVREDAVDKNLDIVTKIMLDPPIARKFGIRLTVPLAVECQFGYSWNDPASTTRVYD